VFQNITIQKALQNLRLEFTSLSISIQFSIYILKPVINFSLSFGIYS